MPTTPTATPTRTYITRTPAESQTGPQHNVDRTRQLNLQQGPGLTAFRNRGPGLAAGSPRLSDRLCPSRRPLRLKPHACWYPQRHRLRGTSTCLRDSPASPRPAGPRSLHPGRGSRVPRPPRVAWRAREVARRGPSTGPAIMMEHEQVEVWIAAAQQGDRPALAKNLSQ